jgi:mono/diheme cytochrome c family protein
MRSAGGSVTAFRRCLLSLLALSVVAACNREEIAPDQITPPSVIGGVIPGGFGGFGGLGGLDGGVPMRLGELRTAAKTPPPISGGNLAVDKAGTVAVVADSDRDLLYVIDLTEGSVQKLKLDAGAEPGRVALDGDKAAHVALRGTGKLVRVDLATASAVAETDVCSHPRGVVVDEARARVIVSCLDGQLVQLDAETHEELDRTSGLPTDLRDVLLGADGVEAVTRYRSAELVRLNPNQSVKSTTQPRKGQRIASPFPVGPRSPAQFSTSTPSGSSDPFAGPDAGTPGILALSPTLVWRTFRAATGNYWMLHQESQDGPVVISEGGGYGSGGCNTITSGKVSELDPNGVPLRSMSVPLLGLSVDAALSPNGQWLAIASPGAYLRSIGTLQVYASSGMLTDEPVGECQTPQYSAGDENQTVAVVFDDNNVLYAYSREPAELQIYAPPEQPASNGVAGGIGGTTFSVPGVSSSGARLTRKATIALDLGSARDTGHDLFHADVGQGLACASCHGEALDDGHVWSFDTIGPRRTQNMRGGLLATAPFHWDGDMTNMNVLVGEVMTRRMGGFHVDMPYADALGAWIDRQPALTVPAADDAAVARGKTLFSAPSTQCSSCHSGKNFTNNESKDVGTGGTFQVPGLLGLALRAPYMHNGCAKALEQRFEASCGGGDKHGTTSKLKASELADLVAYLKSL